MAKNKRRNNAGRKRMSPEQRTAAKIERGTANPRVIARQDCFRHFMGDKAIGHEMTCVGRLRIVGAFDGLNAEPDAILSAFLDYARSYWGNYGGGPQVAAHGKIKVDGSPPPVAGEIDPETKKLKDPAGEWFGGFDRKLRDAGRAVREAVHSITVDRYWFPDENADWADRIINRRILDKRQEYISSGRAPPATLAVAGEIALNNDCAWGMLELVRLGGLALVGERLKIAA